MKPWRSIPGSVAALHLTFLCRVANADAPTGAEQARALFRDARGLAAEGKYDEACPKFEESLKLDVGIGTKFNLADCLEHVKRLTAARTMFLEVADLSHQSGQREREDAARKRASALDAAIPVLVLDVKETSPKLEIRADGSVVESKAWQTPRPMDPGTHTIQATAPGRKPWSSEINLTLEGSPLTVAVPVLESSDTAKTPVAVVPESKAPRATERHAETKRRSAPPPSSEDKTVPIVLFAGAGVGAVLATASLVLYKTDSDKADKVCPTGIGCTESQLEHHRSLVKDADTTRGLAYVGFGLTGASLAAGAILLLAQPHRSGKEQARPGAISAAPVVGRDQVGIAMDGSFW